MQMSLTKQNSYNITSLNDSKAQTAGKGLAVVGGSGLAVYVLAALLPFVSVLGVSVVAGIAGLILLAKSRA
jgi:hypothetical protein